MAHLHISRFLFLYWNEHNPFSCNVILREEDTATSRQVVVQRADLIPLVAALMGLVGPVDEAGREAALEILDRLRESIVGRPDT